MTAALLESLIGIAARAADVVCEVYARDFSVTYKGPRDPITEADRRANELICSELGAHFPDIPVVAEESDESRFSGYRNAPRVFFVDPVDGTREFVARNGEFAVMIGLLEDDRATHGVIHAPAQQTAWAGSVGRGAFRIEPDGARTKIRVSECSDIARARVVASRSHRTRALERALERLGALDLVTLGSAGLKAAAIADGRADIYASPFSAGKRWDACAPDAIVTAAGGVFTDRYGAQLDYRGRKLDNDRGVVTAAPMLHAQVLKLLDQHGR